MTKAKGQNVAKPFKRLVEFCLDCSLGLMKVLLRVLWDSCPQRALWGKCLETDMSNQTQFWGVQE